jgi:outer membrane autotransporter protein
MVLVASLTLAQDGLNRNETSIAENLSDAFAAGSSTSLQPLINALVSLPNVDALSSALDQLAPEVYLDTEIAALFSNLSFTNSMMTCPERDGAAAFIREGHCVWARVSGRFYDQDTTFQTLGFNETNFQISSGGQVALGGAWRLGGALGYEHSELETSTSAQSGGNRFNGGGVLTYNPGALLLSAAVSGGRGSYDIERPIAFPGFSALAKGDTDIDNVDGRLRAAYLFDFGRWYLKPRVDLDATRLDLDGTKESGAGGASLVVRGNDQTYLSASPALELGTQFAMANGTLIRPYVRGGATMFDETDFTLKASFAGTPKGVAPFRIRTGIDDVVADVSAGVEVLDLRGASVKLFYDGRFGDTIQENAAGAKATVPF